MRALGERGACSRPELPACGPEAEPLGASLLTLYKRGASSPTPQPVRLKLCKASSCCCSWPRTPRKADGTGLTRPGPHQEPWPRLGAGPTPGPSRGTFSAPPLGEQRRGPCLLQVLSCLSLRGSYIRTVSPRNRVPDFRPQTPREETFLKSHLG